MKNMAKDTQSSSQKVLGIANILSLCSADESSGLKKWPSRVFTDEAKKET